MSGDDIEADADVVFVTVSVPDAVVGDRIAEVLVGERLAACVKRSGPVRSTYRWHGSVQQEEEVVLSCITTRGQFEALAVRVRDLHPYEVPEILATPVVAGSQDYLAWVRSGSSPA